MGLHDICMMQTNSQMLRENWIVLLTIIIFVFQSAYDKILKGKKAAEIRHKELDGKRKKFKEGRRYYLSPVLFLITIRYIFRVSPDLPQTTLFYGQHEWLMEHAMLLTRPSLVSFPYKHRCRYCQISCSHGATFTSAHMCHLVLAMVNILAGLQQVSWLHMNLYTKNIF